MQGRAGISRRMRRVALATLVAALGAGAIATSGFGQFGGDTLTASRFTLTIDGFEVASFAELTSITSEVQPAEFVESTDKKLTLSSLPGKRKPPTVTFRRGLSDNLDLWAWHDAAVRGNLATARRSVSLAAFDPEGRRIARWHLENAWPAKIEVGTVVAGSSRPLVEGVTIVAENLTRVAP